MPSSEVAAGPCAEEGRDEEAGVQASWEGAAPCWGRRAVGVRAARRGEGAETAVGAEGENGA